jgi:hypothetical protein
MANRQKDPDEIIKYLVLGRNGDFVIEVPAHWKLTFGYVNPASSGGGGFKEGHCLRCWEGEKLRAVFGDVTGFRDMAIPLARKVQKETGSAEWTRDSLGNFKESRDGNVETSLVLESSEDDPF